MPLFRLERHALVRTLFLIPIIHSTYIFGLTGGILSLAISTIIMLPRILFISPYPRDALFEMITVIVIGMKERANLIGGTLTISSTPQKGTIVHLKIPCKD